jgi:hypothetical protein
MKYPNAYKGVKKIFLAEILMLLGALLSIAAVIILSTGGVTVSGIFAVAVPILALIAFILNLVGVINCRKDDESFKIAFYVTLIGIVCSIISAIFSTNETLVVWMQLVQTLCNLFASYYILGGIANLAGTYPDNATKELALKARSLLIFTFLASAIIRLISNIFNIQNEVVLLILGIVILVLEIVSYVLYLRALAAGKNMLAN